MKKILVTSIVLAFCSYTSITFAAQPAQPALQKEDKENKRPKGSVFLVQDTHPLHTAVKDKDTQKIKEILKNNSVFLYTVDEDQNTPLHIAAETGNEALVKLLLDKNETLAHNIGLNARSINCLTRKNINGKTAADVALESGFVSIEAMINTSEKYVKLIDPAAAAILPW